MNAPFPSLVRNALLGALVAAGLVVALPAGAESRGMRPPGGRVYTPGPIRPSTPQPWGGRHFDGYRGGHWNGWWIVGTPWLFYPPYSPYYSYPPVVVQQEAPITLPNLPPAPQSWYYCDSAQAYYPYAQSCPEGWRSVPATPAGNTQVAPAEGQHWYYCDSAKGYYPYVQRCPESWRPVAATPPAAPTPDEGKRQP